jgi:membrane protease YdiL (CAAX protease family)
MVLQLEAIVFQGLDVAAAMQESSGLLQYSVQIIKTRIGYLGAGIYEELLFRLILLSFVLWAFHCLSVPRAGRVLLAVLLTSLLFSAAHYVGGRETVLWFSFLFRFLAGVFFAVLFLYRGFGIAVGAHAGYDLLVGLL